MAPKSKTTTIEPSLRAKLSAAVDEAFEADFAIHGPETIAKMRESHPDKYIEAAVRRVATTEPKSDAIDFNDAKSMRDIGLKLLQSVGFNEPDEDSIQAALAANDVFIAKLEAIRDCAQAEGEAN
jgi:hypothetical protein